LPDALQTSNRQSLLSVRSTQCSPWLGNAQHWCLTMTLGLPYDGEQRTTVSSRVAIYLGLSSHSLRAGGTMAMKLSGASGSTIMKVGQWSSLTYLSYIHSQLGALTASPSKLMATQRTFQNVRENISPLVSSQVGTRNGCGVGSQKNKVFRPLPPILRVAPGATLNCPGA
jgi:hypothetical protein